MKEPKIIEAQNKLPDIINGSNSEEKKTIAKLFLEYLCEDANEPKDILETVESEVSTRLKIRAK